MRIVVISDTHIPVVSNKIPSKILEELKNSDLCIHAGDLIDTTVTKEILQYTELKAVKGNMDSNDIQKNFPDKLILKLDEVKIGLIHGSGSPFNIISRVEDSFEEPLDMYIFGHTHSAYDKIHEGKIFFNPGSPTDKFFSKFNSYGILNIEGDCIERKIIVM